MQICKIMCHFGYRTTPDTGSGIEIDLYIIWFILYSSA